jgi:SAM-dependent methyltransferase
LTAKPEAAAGDWRIQVCGAHNGRVTTAASPPEAVPLIETRRLDPRPAALAMQTPFANAAHIPADELPIRMHELPPRGNAVDVLESPHAIARSAAHQAADWLRAHGREIRLVSETPPLRPPAATHPRRLWQPAPLLLELAARLRPGRAIDLACGAGRESAYLASCGWQVCGVDCLPDALALAAGLAQRCLPAARQPAWRTVDLERPQVELGFAAPYDLAVLCRYLHRPLLRELGRWMRPGGVVMISTFGPTHRTRWGKPARDEHILSPREAPDVLAGWHVQVCRERWRGTACLVEVVAAWRPTSRPRK